MDDAKDDNELKGHLNTVTCFSDHIGMDFRLDKCANVTFNKKGELQKHTQQI